MNEPYKVEGTKAAQREADPNWACLFVWLQAIFSISVRNLPMMRFSRRDM